jgi:DNA-binding MarR family transcriptional regulator
MNWPIIDWRHDNTGRLFYDSTRRFQDGVLALVNQAGFPQIRIAHLAVTRHVDVAGTRIADVAHRAGVTKQSISQMIDNLQAMGFLTREPDPRDKRAKIVVFTPEGLALLAAIREAVETCEQELRSRVGERAWRQMRLTLIDYCRGAAEPARARRRTIRAV